MLHLDNIEEEEGEPTNAGERDVGAWALNDIAENDDIRYLRADLRDIQLDEDNDTPKNVAPDGPTIEYVVTDGEKTDMSIAATSGNTSGGTANHNKSDVKPRDVAASKGAKDKKPSKAGLPPHKTPQMTTGSTKRLGQFTPPSAEKPGKKLQLLHTPAGSRQQQNK